MTPGTIGDRPADGYDVVLLDLDGVVYVGGEPVPGAVDGIATLRAGGRTVFFVTNNAARSALEVSRHLRRVGVPAEPADVVTSGQVAARWLAERLSVGERVLVVGTRALADEVNAVGLRVIRRFAENPAAVVNGYADRLGYAELAEAALAIRAGALWVATNRDATIPTPLGQLPGNGAITALLATATGRQPTSVGKPAPPLLREALRRAGGRRALFVGDRLDTDVAGAVAVGVDSVLVLSGVGGTGDLLRATPAARPTFVAADLAGVLRTQPALRGGTATVHCGDWEATRDRDRVVVTGTGNPIDALRCAATLAWAHLDRTGHAAVVEGLPTAYLAAAGGSDTVEGDGQKKGDGMVMDAVRGYLHLAGGVTEMSRQRARDAAKAMLSGSGSSKEQVSSLAEEITSASRTNRDAMVTLVRHELDRGLGRLGFATSDELAQLKERVSKLERDVRDLRHQFPPPGKKATAKKTTTKSTPAKKSAAKTAAKRSDPRLS